MALVLASMTAIAGCALPTARPRAIIEEPPQTSIGWESVATDTDRQRLAALPAQWTRALAEVPVRLRPGMKAEGALVDPAAALALPAPPPGPYRCRLLRFGGPARYRSYAPDFCYVEGDGAKLSFTKQTGSQLPGGWLYVDGDKRLVFLGALPLAGERSVPLYGKHADRDVAGVVERVSPFRWRLVLTRAGGGALLDIYELVPVTPAVPGASPALPARP